MGEKTATEKIFYRHLSSWYGLLLLLSISFLYFFIGFTQVVDVYDEGIAVYGAQRVLEGDVPYRDFWTIYAPGQFYVLAGLFKIFGSYLLVERLYDTVVRALVSITVLLIALRLVPPGWSFFCWLVVTLWLKYFGYYAATSFPALLLVLASLFFLFGFLGQNRSRWQLFISGALAGAAGLFRHDFGLYALLATLFILVFFAWRDLVPKTDGEGLGGRITGVLSFVLLYFSGFVLSALPVWAYFLSAVPTRELFYDLVVFPLKIFPAVRDVHYPALLPDVGAFFRKETSLFAFFADASKRAAFYFPPFVFLAVLAFLLFKNSRTPRPKGETGADPAWGWRIGFFLIFGILSLNNVRVRSDLPHLLPSFVAAGLLFPALVAKILELRLFRRGLVFGLGLAAAFLLFPYPLHELQKPGVDERYRPLLYVHNLGRAGPIGVNPFQAGAIHYIQNATFPWERIFVASHRHDRIYNSDVIFYFLSERNCATRYHELSPGSATSRKVQSEIIGDLQKNHVRYIAVLSRPPIRGVTNEPVPVRLLDEFIKENYRQVEKFGDWFVLERR